MWKNLHYSVAGPELGSGTALLPSPEAASALLLISLFVSALKATCVCFPPISDSAFSISAALCRRLQVPGRLAGLYHGGHRVKLHATAHRNVQNHLVHVQGSP